ncbi:MAG TPA: BamA/TamA family outer membrane protein [Saprospiraceae bacterium]|nr:BamA/TamA family outer membrane protein [Saprospiraceae bacterium]HMQ82726.1 BamA/TamA family outer membrane protein [Saprospiraceae bacterium]
MAFKLHFLLLACCLLSHGSSAQDSIPDKSYSLAAYPVVFYLPETRLGFGGAGIWAFYFPDDDSRPSQIQTGIAYTLNKQVLLYLPYQVFWDDNRWIAKGELGYYRYFYNYYGIGNQEATDYVEQYEVNYPRFRFNLLYQVLPQFYTGFRYWWDNYQIGSREVGGQLISGTITGGSGGVVSGLGLISIWDTRDHIFYSRKGIVLEATAFWNSKALGSDFNFSRFTIDASSFLSLNTNHILAFNLFAGSIAGEAPFNELMLLGGSKKARGFYEGRFRDKHLALLQIEYRTKLKGRFGAVLFTSVGNVTPDLGHWAWKYNRYNAGAGLRYSLDKKEHINLRLDIGFGQQAIGYYFTIGEAF